MLKGPATSAPVSRASTINQERRLVQKGGGGSDTTLDAAKGGGGILRSKKKGLLSSRRRGKSTRSAEAEQKAGPENSVLSVLGKRRPVPVRGWEERKAPSKA